MTWVRYLFESNLNYATLNEKLRMEMATVGSKFPSTNLTGNVVKQGKNFYVFDYVDINFSLLMLYVLLLSILSKVFRYL